MPSKGRERGSTLDEAILVFTTIQLFRALLPLNTALFATLSFGRSRVRDGLLRAWKERHDALLALGQKYQFQLSFDPPWWLDRSEREAFCREGKPLVEDLMELTRWTAWLTSPRPEGADPSWEQRNEVSLSLAYNAMRDHLLRSGFFSESDVLKLDRRGSRGRRADRRLVAIDALELHLEDPKKWTYMALAQRFCDCWRAPKHGQDCRERMRVLIRQANKVFRKYCPSPPPNLSSSTDSL